MAISRKRILSNKKPTSTKKSSNTKKSIKPIKPITNEDYDIKYQKIKKNISRKDVRKYEVDRISSIISLLPKFANFYNKLSHKEIMALKYYKGAGSVWQTKLLTNEKLPREVSFPFHIFEEQSFAQLWRAKTNPKKK